MSMFFCAECGRLSDADNGCEEAPDLGPYALICVDCADNRAFLREERAAQRAESQ